LNILVLNGSQQLLDRILPLFLFSSPTSPHVSCTAAAAAMITMEKKGGAAYALLPFFSTQ